MLLPGNHIVLLDEQQLDSSVVIPKSIIERLATEGGTVAIVMKEVVRARAAELRTLNFRVGTGGDPAVVTAWFASGPGSYQARHNHSLPNPYELEIKPFAGGNCKLYLDGTGMDPAACKTLVDRVVAARSQR